MSDSALERNERNDDMSFNFGVVIFLLVMFALFCRDQQRQSASGGVVSATQQLEVEK